MDFILVDYCHFLNVESEWKYSAYNPQRIKVNLLSAENVEGNRIT